MNQYLRYEETTRRSRLPMPFSLLDDAWFFIKYLRRNWRRPERCEIRRGKSKRSEL